MYILNIDDLPSENLIAMLNDRKALFTVFFKMRQSWNSEFSQDNSRETITIQWPLIILITGTNITNKIELLGMTKSIFASDCA